MLLEPTYTVTLDNGERKVTSNDLAKYRNMYLSGELGARMSELLWLDLYILDAKFGVSTHEILEAIMHIEKGDLASNGVKPATQFKHLPLKGLWHKHYFSAHFLVNNVVLGLGKTGVEKMTKEVMDPAKSPVVTQEMVEEFARRITDEPIQARHDKDIDW